MSYQKQELVNLWHWTSEHNQQKVRAPAKVPVTLHVTEIWGLGVLSRVVLKLIYSTILPVNSEWCLPASHPRHYRMKRHISTSYPPFKNSKRSLTSLTFNFSGKVMLCALLSFLSMPLLHSWGSGSRAQVGFWRSVNPSPRRCWSPSPCTCPLSW